MPSRPAPGPLPSQSARHVRYAMEQAASLGVDVDALLATVGLSREALRDPERRVPYATTDALLEQAVALTGDERLGLHMAGFPVVDPDDPSSAMIATAATLAESLAQGPRFQRLWGDGERLHFEETEAGVRMRFTPVGPPRPAHRQLAELALAQLVYGVRFLIAPDVHPLRVRFTHAAPADTREHEASFQCPLVFGAPHNDVEYSREDAARPLAHADALAHAVFTHQSQKALAQLGGAERTTSERVREQVQRLLPGGDASFTAVARALRTPERTLQRRLAAEGHTYAALLEEVRRALSLRYLERQVSIAEVSFLLGYSEPSVFHRAFKRWWGQSPEAWRREQGPSGTPR